MQESLVTNEYKPEDILNAVHYNKGILWDKISGFHKQISVLEGAATHEVGKPQEASHGRWFIYQRNIYAEGTLDCFVYT